MKNIDIVSCRLVKDRSINSDIRITTPERAVNLILNSFNDLDRECLFVVNCDNKYLKLQFYLIVVEFL